MKQLAVNDSAPEATLVDQDGRPVKLSDLWREGPLVLFFLRHLG